MTYRMQVRLPGDEESHLWEFTEATRDFADIERQKRIANYQVNWMAALGMCICIASAIAVIALAVYLS